MTQPAGTHDLIRQALAYLLEQRAQRKAQGLPVNGARLLDEAGMRFNLSPVDAGALERLFAENKKHSDGDPENAPRNKEA